MQRIDLIIDALENSDPTGKGWLHVYEQKHQAALAAARELKTINAEMLEALKEIASETYDEWTNGAKAQRIAAAAIAKATGEQA